MRDASDSGQMPFLLWAPSLPLEHSRRKKTVNAINTYLLATVHDTSVTPLHSNDGHQGVSAADPARHMHVL